MYTSVCSQLDDERIEDIICESGYYTCGLAGHHCSCSVVNSMGCDSNSEPPREGVNTKC